MTETGKTTGKQKLRCLRVGCNPKMIAEGVEGAPFSTWKGNDAFIMHLQNHPNHSIAKAPVRSAEGELKQKIRNATGVYPTDTEITELQVKHELAIAERAAKAAEAAIAKAEWDAKRPERIALAEQQRLAGIERRNLAAVRREEELAKAKTARAELVNKISDWNLDADFLQSFIETPDCGAALLKAIEKLTQYGEELRNDSKSDFKRFETMRANLLKKEYWSDKVQREFIEVQGFYTEEEMVKRLALIEQWEALCDQGEEEGWLDWTSDYSGSHLESNTSRQHPTRKQQELEDAEAYADRLKVSVQRVHGSLVAKFSRLKAARALVKSFESGEGFEVEDDSERSC